MTPSQEFWNPADTIQNTIILLVEKIVVAMGDELKVFIPPLVQPVLRLFLQDPSEQQIATQKVCVYTCAGVPVSHDCHMSRCTTKCNKVIQPVNQTMSLDIAYPCFVQVAEW